MGGFPTSLTALVIVISLMPGVAFLVGIYLHRKMTSETVQISAPLAVATVLFVSVLTQMLMMFLVLAPACAAAAKAFCQISLANPEQTVSLTVDEIVFVYASFLAASLATGAFGYGWSALGVRGITRLPFSSSWAARYLNARAIPIAHVATSVEGLDSPILYTGFLADLRLDPAGKIVSLTLIAASRSVLRLTDAGSVMTPDPKSAASLAPLDLIIEGERIQNVAITSQDPVSPTYVAETRLASIIVLIVILASLAVYSAP